MIREFHQISLRGRNSFGVDQRAARLVEFETAEDLRTFFAAGIPGRWTVLAGGNNILFTEDYDGVLLTPVARQIALLSDDGDEVRLRVEAGVEWDDLVEWAVERGLWGIENLSLIPGKAGSAPVQNIGAYGCEAKDAIRRVEMYCVETGTVLTLDAAHCGFGYRESVFKHDLKGRVIITAIEIRLSHTPRPKLGYGDVEREVEARGGATLRNIREAICSIRRAKLPDPAVLGNAGSFFKNPVVEAPVAKRLLAEGKPVQVVLGFNTASEVFYEEEFRALGCEVAVSTVDGSRGVGGFVTTAIAERGLDFDYFYACGPLPMLHALYNAVEQDGQLSFEERMGCGFGACMGCSCKTKYGYKRICKEGPVLTKDEIIW